MASFARALVVPFFVALFPALWYVNRNVTTAVLPPRVDPTTETIALAVAVAVLGSVGVAAVAAPFVQRLLDGSSGRLRRALVPENRTLLAISGLLCGVAAYALSAIAGVGPSWLATLSLPIALLVALPFLFLVPFFIEASPIAHTIAVAGLAASALWMAVLATSIVDAIDRYAGRATDN